MKHCDSDTVSLTFALDVKDGWPPAGAECLPFHRDGGGFRLLVAPLFVRGLSVGDVIECEIDRVNGMVFEWSHLSKSGHSTFWLLRQDDEQVLLDGLEKLRALGCSTVLAPRVGMFSVDVPAAISIDAVDAVFQGLVDHGVAIACPSLRHE